MPSMNQVRSPSSFIAKVTLLNLYSRSIEIILQIWHGIFAAYHAFAWICIVEFLELVKETNSVLLIGDVVHFNVFVRFNIIF
jgi:hypothetical protein